MAKISDQLEPLNPTCSCVTPPPYEVSPTPPSSIEHSHAATMVLEVANVAAGLPNGVQFYCTFQGMPRGVAQDMCADDESLRRLLQTPLKA